VDAILEVIRILAIYAFFLLIVVVGLSLIFAVVFFVAMGEGLVGLRSRFAKRAG
jgi:hypothetical protein